jgi:hypothetical protein
MLSTKRTFRWTILLNPWYDSSSTFIHDVSSTLNNINFLPSRHHDSIILFCPIILKWLKLLERVVSRLSQRWTSLSKSPTCCYPIFCHITRSYLSWISLLVESARGRLTILLEICILSRFQWAIHWFLQPLVVQLWVFLQNTIQIKNND